MYFRSLLSGTLALLLVSGGAALASDSASPRFTVPLPKSGLPGVFGAQSREGQVRVAQAADPRITAVEEQVRALNGTIEELNFQILQMQEQLRKIQEDNEFRFQELEKSKKSDAGPAKTDGAVAEVPPAATATEPPPAATATTTPPPQTGEAVAAAEAKPPAGTGAPAKTFGTITVDKNGNVVGAEVGEPVDLLQGNNAAKPDASVDVAALPKTDDPEEVYRNSYQFILSGDYATAEAGFRDHIKRFPKDAKTADAHYWLGESLLGQQNYRDAAEVFLAANKDYPKSKKAPDMLLKLGVSLAGLSQRDVACATFAEVTKRYPDASKALKDRVKQEQALAAC